MNGVPETSKHHRKQFLVRGQVKIIRCHEVKKFEFLILVAEGTYTCLGPVFRQEREKLPQYNVFFFSSKSKKNEK